MDKDTEVSVSVEGDKVILKRQKEVTVTLSDLYIPLVAVSSTVMIILSLLNLAGWTVWEIYGVSFSLATLIWVLSVRGKRRGITLKVPEQTVHTVRGLPDKVKALNNRKQSQQELAYRFLNGKKSLIKQDLLHAEMLSVQPSYVLDTLERFPSQEKDILLLLESPEHKTSVLELISLVSVTHNPNTEDAFLKAIDVLTAKRILDEKAAQALEAEIQEERLRKEQAQRELEARLQKEEKELEPNLSEDIDSIVNTVVGEEEAEKLLDSLWENL